MAAREKKLLQSREEGRGKEGSLSKSDPEWGGKCRESLAAAKAILNSPYLKNRSDHAHQDKTPVDKSAAVIPPKALHGLLSPSPPREVKETFSSNEPAQKGKQESQKKSGIGFQPLAEDQLMASIEQLIASHHKQNDAPAQEDPARLKRSQVCLALVLIQELPTGSPASRPC